MLDDDKWAGIHHLTALSHTGLALTGVFFFIFGYHGFDAPFEKAAMLPWATMPFGIFGAILTGALWAGISKADQTAAPESPLELYHRRRGAMIGCFLILSFFGGGDLAFAVNYSAAATDYEVLSSYQFAAVMAAIAAYYIPHLSRSLCVLTFVANLSKWYGQWRPEYLKSLLLEENQEGLEEEGLLGNFAQSEAEPAADSIELENRKSLMTDDAVLAARCGTPS